MSKPIFKIVFEVNKPIEAWTSAATGKMWNVWRGSGGSCVMCHDLCWQHQCVLECRSSSWCLHCNYPTAQMLPDPHTHLSYMYSHHPSSQSSENKGKGECTHILYIDIDSQLHILHRPVYISFYKYIFFINKSTRQVDRQTDTPCIYKYLQMIN